MSWFIPKLVIGGAVVIALAILTMMFGSWFTVDQGDRAVITRNGAVVRVEDAGLHGKAPWLESVHSFSVRQHKETVTVRAVTADAQPVGLSLTVNMHVLPNKVDYVYTTYGVDYKDALVQPRIQKFANEITGRTTTKDMIAHQDTFTALLEKSVITDLEGTGIAIDSVQFAERPAFSPEFIASVENAMKQAQDLIAQTSVAQKKVVDATAERDAAKARADGEAYAIRQKGDAEAAAITARANALKQNPDLVHLQAVEKWNGVLPTSMIPGSAVPFVALQSAQRN